MFSELMQTTWTWFKKTTWIGRVESNNPQLVLIGGILKHHLHLITWNLLQMIMQRPLTKKIPSLLERSYCRSPLSEDMNSSHALMLKEIKQLETRLENQILKRNILEKEPEKRKKKRRTFPPRLWNTGLVSNGASLTS